MYVITGASGNTGKIIAQKLLAAGKSVTVVGRSAEHLAEFAAQGAHLAIGSLEDAGFVHQAFAGAQAVYAMIPPNFAAPQFTEYQFRVADHLAAAIRAHKIPHVVALSSIGGHLLDNGGVVRGVGYLEQQLRAIEDTNVLNLRPGFFYQNLFGSIGLVKQLGALAGFPIRGEVAMPMIHTTDIAAVAAQRLLALDFVGKSVQFLGGERDLTFDEVAGILGTAIGKPELKWLAFDYVGARAGMIQSGMQANLADNYIQFCERVNDGSLVEGFVRDTSSTTPTSIEQFAKEWAAAYTQAQ